MEIASDYAKVQEAAARGKRATVPKHGKSPENRLWSKTKRGDGKQKERDGINPDGSLDVACVCGNEVRTYGEVKFGRRLKSVLQFSHRGAAIQYAHEYEEAQRKSD
jgi:hypothetical protein